MKRAMMDVVTEVWFHFLLFPWSIQVALHTELGRMEQIILWSRSSFGVKSIRWERMK